MQLPCESKPTFINKNHYETIFQIYVRLFCRHFTHPFDPFVYLHWDDNGSDFHVGR